MTKQERDGVLEAWDMAVMFARKSEPVSFMTMFYLYLWQRLGQAFIDRHQALFNGQI